MELTIDGKKIKADKGQFLLDVATANGIQIPTLCHHPGVALWGGCRLCIVEISHPDWLGWWKLVTSCLYPAEDKLVVDTKSDKVMQTRTVILDLLLARCPDSPEIQTLAREYGIDTTTFQPRENPDTCILCGLCVRICESVGAAAISTLGRGVDKFVDVPYESDLYAACVGCLSCATNCPTNAIPYEQTDTSRTIWKRNFDLVFCADCGTPLGTSQQLELYVKKTGLPASYFEKCDTCRRKDTAVQFSKVVFK